MIDIGVNLGHSRMIDQAGDILVRARQAGVTQCIVTGTNCKESMQAQSLCQEHNSKPATADMLRFTSGIHPHDASQYSIEAMASIETLCQDPLCVAVGETGLDFNRNFSTEKQQTDCFEAHLRLAQKIGKPLFLHERDAYSTFYAIVRQQEDLQGVVHCFTGSKESLYQYLDLGLYIGLTGWICDERRGLDIADLARLIPVDRLLIETDAPYLLPRNMAKKPKSRTNEPSFLPWIVKQLSISTGRSESDLIATTADNSRRLFGL